MPVQLAPSTNRIPMAVMLRMERFDQIPVCKIRFGWWRRSFCFKIGELIDKWHNPICKKTNDPPGNSRTFCISNQDRNRRSRHEIGASDGTADVAHDGTISNHKVVIVSGRIVRRQPEWRRWRRRRSVGTTMNYWVCCRCRTTTTMMRESSSSSSFGGILPHKCSSLRKTPFRQ